MALRPMRKCGLIILTAERPLDEDWAIKTVGSSNRKAGEESRKRESFKIMMGVGKVNMILRDPAVWSCY